MVRFSTIVLTTLLWLSTAAAQSSAPVDVLYRAIGMPAILDIMREEGLVYGEELREDLFPGSGGVRWSATVSRIYDPDLI